MARSHEDTAWSRGGAGRRESSGKGTGNFLVKAMLALLFWVVVRRCTQWPESPNSARKIGVLYANYTSIKTFIMKMSEHIL